MAVVFMPQITSAYAFMALATATGSRNTLLYLAIAVVFAALIQVSSLLVYIQLSRKDVNIADRQDRPTLFVIATISYLVGFILLRGLLAPFIFSALMFAYFANSILAAVITKYLTKVSVHTWGITGPSVAILHSLGILAFAAALALGVVVGITRITLRYHTWAQVLLSFVVSIPFTWFIVYLVPTIFPTMFSL